MDHVEFTIPGRLKGKGRHRARIAHGKAGQAFVQTYPDKDTVSAESMVRRFANEAMAGRPPFAGPLALQLVIKLNTPPSWSKRKRAEARHVTGKPDLDNVVKLIGDACNGILWADDSQLCDIRVRRIYDDTAGECVNICVASADWKYERSISTSPITGLFARGAA